MAPLMVPVDPSGNTVLHTSASSLCVSSKTLSLASSVFASLFTSTPASVNLPSDDPVALTVIVNIFHFNFVAVPKEDISLELLFQIARVGDKYDCIRALGPWIDKWLSRWGDKKAPCKDYEWRRLLVISHIFGRLDIFEWAGKQAVLAATYEELNSCINAGLFPGSEKAVANIQEHRARLISSILECTSRFMKKILTAENLCSKHSARCEALFLGSALKGVVRCGPYPPPSSPYPGMSVDKIIMSLKRFDMFVESEHKECFTVANEWKAALLLEVDRRLQSLGVVTSKAVEAYPTDMVEESPKEAVLENVQRISQPDALPTLQPSTQALENETPDSKAADPTLEIAIGAVQQHEHLTVPTEVLEPKSDILVNGSFNSEDHDVVDEALPNDKPTSDTLPDKIDTPEKANEVEKPLPKTETPAAAEQSAQGGNDLYSISLTSVVEDAPSTLILSHYREPDDHEEDNAGLGSAIVSDSTELSTPLSTFTEGREIVAEDIEDMFQSDSEQDALEQDSNTISQAQQSQDGSDDGAEEDRGADSTSDTPFTTPTTATSDDIRAKTITLERIYPEVPSAVITSILTRFAGDLVAGEKQLEHMRRNLEAAQRKKREQDLEEKKVKTAPVPDPRLEGKDTVTLGELAKYIQITRSLHQVFPNIDPTIIMLAVKRNGGDEQKAALELSGEMHVPTATPKASVGAKKQGLEPDSIANPMETPKPQPNAELVVTAKKPDESPPSPTVAPAGHILSSTGEVVSSSAKRTMPIRQDSGSDSDGTQDEYHEQRFHEELHGKKRVMTQADKGSVTGQQKHQQQVQPHDDGKPAKNSPSPSILQPVGNNAGSKLLATPSPAKQSAPPSPIKSPEVHKVTWTPSERAQLMSALANIHHKDNLRVLRRRFRNVESARVLDSFYRSGWDIESASDALRNQGFTSVAPGAGLARENSKNPT